MTTATRNPQGLNASGQRRAGEHNELRLRRLRQCARITDPAGHVTTNVYDLRGNRTSTADLDMGTWYYTYDGLGRLLTQSDAQNQTHHADL